MPSGSRGTSSPAVEAGLVVDLEAAEARRLAAEVAHTSATAARQEAADDTSRWGARAEALHLALESARARAGAEHLAGVEDVLGTLLDLIDIDTGWEAAVGAALGDALEAVVVASPRAGRRAPDSLHGSNVHGVVICASGPARSRVAALARPRRSRAVSRPQPAAPVFPNPLDRRHRLGRVRVVVARCHRRG